MAKGIADLPKNIDGFLGETNMADLFGLPFCHRDCERILGVACPAGPGMSTKDLAKLDCTAIGRTVDDVLAEILTPAVQLACVRKLSRATTSTFRARIAPTGVISPILEPAKRKRHLKDLSRSEHKQSNAEDHRRKKKRLSKRISAVPEENAT